ncbi:MAG: hypothetical protein UV73_C0001G0231 [Candidatus Gottesmanbacteria bacterium GW2011_GWA2_43_14]|uniref:Lysine biosynthesis protein LysW n=1 Tax=Candidatus Gottesmanbacteria bacterium GW2011_GWA2_43_14 TaxID=1618443 RepID=A0A0G1DLI0_9BACT|nr:MAG: hypothetical protein UV73_C0001G0231 [Candidatus Gottesmanbacteria bacterium GW2011_GWA2_43_14]
MGPSQNQIAKFVCPECNNPLVKDREIKIGILLECPSCGTEIEVVSVNPLKLAPLEEEK